MAALSDKTDSACLLDSKYTPYYLSNESRREDTFASLSRIPIKKGGGHIGFSCCENLDIIAQRKSSFAILGDINPRVKQIMDLTREVIGRSKDRRDFVQNMHDVFPAWARERDKDDLFNELDRKESWLGSDEAFAYIASMYKENRIEHRTFDASENPEYQKISLQMAMKKLHCDTFYISNIPDWIAEDDDGAKKLQALKRCTIWISSPDTMIIHSSMHFSGAAEIQQVVFKSFAWDPAQLISKNI